MKTGYGYGSELGRKPDPVTDPTSGNPKAKNLGTGSSQKIYGLRSGQKSRSHAPDLD
jgi:hypothetical protein